MFILQKCITMYPRQWSILNVNVVNLFTSNGEYTMSICEEASLNNVGINRSLNSDIFNRGFRIRFHLTIQDVLPSGFMTENCCICSIIGTLEYSIIVYFISRDVRETFPNLR